MREVRVREVRARVRVQAQSEAAVRWTIDEAVVEGQSRDDDWCAMWPLLTVTALRRLQRVSPHASADVPGALPANGGGSGTLPERFFRR